MGGLKCLNRTVGGGRGVGGGGSRNHESTRNQKPYTSSRFEFKQRMFNRKGLSMITMTIMTNSKSSALIIVSTKHNKMEIIIYAERMLPYKQIQLQLHIRVLSVSKVQSNQESRSRVCRSWARHPVEKCDKFRSSWGEVLLLIVTIFMEKLCLSF